MNKIYKNVVKCKKCGDIVESFHKDFTSTCKCGSVKISGGTDALIREGLYEEMSQYFITE
jgi:Zn finger protein HypA/HybF involved in hydrogenase expression